VAAARAALLAGSVFFLWSSPKAPEHAATMKRRKNALVRNSARLAVLWFSASIFQGQSGPSCPPLSVHVGSTVRALAFSPDGKTLAAGGDDKTITLWNTLTGKAERSWSLAQPVLQLVFNPRGKQLASLGPAGEIAMWDSETGKVEYRSSGWPLIFTPDGESWVMAGSRSLPAARKNASAVSRHLTLEVHNSETGKLVRTLDKVPLIRVTSLVITADDRILAAGCSDQDDDSCTGAVVAWKFSTGALLKNQRSEATTISPDGRWLADATNGHLNLFDLAKNSSIRFPLRSDRTQAALAFTPDSEEIAVAQEAPVSPTVFEYQGYLDRRLLPSGKQFTGLQSSASNLADGTPLPRTSPEAFGPVVYSPDRKRLAAANYTYQTQREVICNTSRALSRTFYSLVKIWDLDTGKEMTLVREEKNQ
jgi:WD40 repeat protein